MKWLALTFGALAACLGLAGWIYLRDMDAAPVRNTPLLQARTDALLMLDRLTGPTHCAGCVADVSRRSDRRLWDVHLHGPFGRRCFTVHLAKFAISPDHGITGVQSAACDGAQALARTTRKYRATQGVEQ
jgi:hypothetical protein